MKALSRSLVAFACLGGLVACAPNLVFTKTTSVQAQAREATCTFELLTTRPDRTFDELGIIDVETLYAHLRPHTASEFRKAVQPQTCAAGGDAVLAGVNGDGEYVRGTVIRYRTATAADTTP